MMKSSFLNGELVFLRAVEPEDLDIMFDMENDPEMWDISSFTVPYSKHVLRQYILDTSYDLYADKQVRLMIVRQADQTTIGTIDITDFVPLHSRASVGIALRADCRGKGYGVEALRLLMDYAFRFLKLKQLCAFIAVTNQPSRHLFEQCGFQQSGILKDWLFLEDTYVDAVLMQCQNPRMTKTHSATESK